MHPMAIHQLELFAEVKVYPWDHPDLTDDMLASDALITYTPRFNRETIWRAERLKVVSAHSCPYEFKQIADERGIVVTDVPSLWGTVAEFTIALLLAAARNIPQAHQDIRDGLWKDSQDLKVRYSGQNIFGKTIGIIGMGRIGSIVAKRLTGFDSRIVYYDIERKRDLEQILGIEYMEFIPLLQNSNYIILLAPLLPETKGMFGKKQFEQMKPGSIFVNTARGALVDERELFKALAEKKISAAALDVYQDEPVLPDNPLLTLDNVVFAPHLGGSTYDCDMVLVNDVYRVLKGKKPLHPV